MQERIKINVIIAERTYPMFILKEEEKIIRNSVKDISIAIKNIEANYAVRDKQDALSMYLLQYISKSKIIELNYEKEKKKLQNILDDLFKNINKVL